MWKCTIDFSSIYKVVAVICNDKSVYDKVCTYYSQLLVDNNSDCDNIINIITFETYTRFSGSEIMSFETERGNELESLLHLMEEIIFQNNGYNNLYLPLHASAIINSCSEAILLVGGTHSGKSTLLLYLITKGFSFYADDLILVDRESTQLKYFPRPLHVREKTMFMFSDYFQTQYTKIHKLSNDSYFVKLPYTEIKSTVVKTIIEVKYNQIENSFIEKIGFNKVLNITKNMKGTNVSNWHKNLQTFRSVQYFDLKYKNFEFVDKLIAEGMLK